MDLNVLDRYSTDSATTLDAERPSEDFIRAVADLLETDADGILSEMGYRFPEFAEVTARPVEA
jgi:hypothetical protein